jgi:hypothetical protein
MGERLQQSDEENAGSSNSSSPTKGETHSGSWSLIIWLKRKTVTSYACRFTLECPSWCWLELPKPPDMSEENSDPAVMTFAVPLTRWYYP